jgi:predicted exporter
MRNWLENLMVGARRHPIAVAISAVVLTAAGGFLVSRVTFDADVLKLLPRRSPPLQDLRMFLQEFGSLDHLYVVFDTTDAVADHSDLVNAYVTALRAAPEIESVDAQLMDPDKDWTYLSDRVLLLVGSDDASAALERFRRPRLDREVLHARDLLSMPSPQVKAYVQRDPLGLFGALRSRMEEQKGALSIDPTQEGYVTADGHSRLLIVKPRGAPFDVDFCGRLFRRLADVEASARKTAGTSGEDQAAVTIETAGAYRVSLEAERLIRREGVVNTTVSLAVLLLVVVAIFRTPWMLLLGTIPIGLAAILSLGLNGLIRGSLSPATSGSAGMLFGLGIDGVVLLYVRYLEERQAGLDPLEATRKLAGTAASVVLAQVTTIATFFALLVLDFPTLQDLGALVGLGMVLVCPLTLILLPPMLPRSTGRAHRRAPAAPWLGALVTRRSGAILSFGIALTIGLGVAARHLQLDPRIERLQARTPGVDQEREIARRFSLPLDVLLVLRSDTAIDPLVEADVRLRTRLAAWDSSITASGISLLLPPAQAQAAVAHAIETSGIDAATIERDLGAAARDAGFRADTFAPFLSTLPHLLNPAERVTYDGLMSHGLGPVVSRFLVRRPDGYATAAYLYPQRPVDLDALARVVRQADAGFRLTGLSVVNHELARTFLPEFGRGVAIGTVAVTILLYAVFRTVRQTALALLPTIVGFIWSAGVLALLRVNLDLFSLFATVTFIGIAVDYGIYILYRHAVEASSDVGTVLSRTGPAIAIACLTALIGFGTLVFSSYEPLRVFGLVSVVTLVCCLLASLVFLPAVLVLLDSWSRPAR